MHSGISQYLAASFFFSLSKENPKRFSVALTVLWGGTGEKIKAKDTSKATHWRHSDGRWQSTVLSTDTERSC
jgi:hypothetical protein